jgi:ketosteroid isomerase-like protein
MRTRDGQITRARDYSDQRQELEQLGVLPA